MVFPTVEVRWFHRQRVPSDVEAWFHGTPGTAVREPRREDRYLRPLDVAGLGIKLRHGRVEIKQRVHQEGAIRLHQRVTGVVEHWRKWSFELARSDVNPGSTWIPVRKDRRLRQFRVVGDGSIVAVPTHTSPDQGCELELTLVEVAGQVWWTLAFEAFGPPSSLQANLLAVARHAFSLGDPPALDAQDSQGYVEWLRTAVQNQGEPS